MKSVILGLFVSIMSGCSLEPIDYWFFEFTGGTLVKDPSQLTTKELHFDTGGLLGKEVIIEGKISSTGRLYTYLILNDDSGRMLVVLTQIERAEEVLERVKPERLKVLGTVERGKKGLPYILAKAISPVSVSPQN